MRLYFCRCVETGQTTAALDQSETFEELRRAGIAAEKAMYEATCGVNTHNGAIYSMGVLLGALGRLWSVETPISELPFVLSESARLVKGSVLSDFRMFSTSIMIKCGYVYENLMVNMKAKNIKLEARMISMIHDITGLDNETCEQYLKETNWNIRDAIALWEERK